MVKAIYAYGGLAGAGKTYCALRKQRDLMGAGLSVAYRPFAEPLKRLLNETLGYPPGAPLNASKEGEDGRGRLQRLGAGLRDMAGPHFWADLWRKNLPDEEVTVIVDDLRYPEEVEAILHSAPETHFFLVTRSGNEIPDPHPSEQLLWVDYCRAHDIPVHRIHSDPRSFHAV